MHSCTRVIAFQRRSANAYRIFVRLQSSSASTKDPVRWFYATDVPKTKPPYFNYKQQKPATKFKAFSRVDSQRIENALLKQHTQEAIPVREDGLFSVDIDGRVIVPTYWDGPTFEVRRGTWFYSQGPTPVPEQVALEIDELWAQKGTESSQLKSINGTVKFSKNRESAVITTKDQRFEIFGSKIVRGFNEKDADGDASTTTSQESSPTAEDTKEEVLAYKLRNILGSSKSSEQSMSRQMQDDYGATSEFQSREVNHLLLCVHGIGQRLAQKIESLNFVHDINVFRKLLRTTFTEDAAFNSDRKRLGGDNQVQVLPVLWRHDVPFGMTHEELEFVNKKSDYSVTLEDITVDGIVALRSIVGDVVLDVLMYNQAHYHEQVLEAVVDHLNRVYEKFCAIQQSTPTVSLIGHSLGSVICYDILSNSKYSSRLKFDPKHLFAIGSPVGLFELLGKRKISADNFHAKYLYNIFHPSDPIAYRMEPLVTSEASSLPPAVVPLTGNGLRNQLQELTEIGQKISQGATSVWNNVASAWKTEIIENEEQKKKGENIGDLTKAQAKAIKSELATLNPTGRIDYVLQESLLDISIVAAIASHVSYFENEDTAAFVLHELYAR
ncbi:probable phospholipase YOR022C, mitochondrial [Trichomonascus vanleenenianus]|uniref:putative carboxylic ester hydrolase n=1 Tax=Trichomonascus vanleenenianus TaxID=2268995 RepID=UPI003ECAB76D